MALDRRSLLRVGAGLAGGFASAATLSGAHAAPADAAPLLGRHRTRPGRAAPENRSAPTLDTEPAGDVTETLQAMIDDAAAAGEPLVLPPGRFVCATLTLRHGSRVSGTGSSTVLVAAGAGPLLRADGADGITIENLILDGAHLPPVAGATPALVALVGCRRAAVLHVEIRNSGGTGILLDGASGRVAFCRVAFAADAAVHAIDCAGLEIAMNEISDCGNNGIQVWRRQTAEDGAVVHANRISRIAARGGGSGQNGNGINVFRAAGVSVTGNRITDCAYSAIRGNAASDIHITGNSCQRLGEVAIYAEFGFEGALIAQNLVDGAATGISVTNFDIGGRLAVIQGNLIRNLVRREHEPTDKRGEGIAVEADATVTGNTVEGAPTAGIVIGWGRHMRDCVATANLIRNTRVGIMISSDNEAGAALVSGNMISGATDGAIRAMTLGRPHGPDLALTATETPRIRISGNMAVP